jgi:hypothetical protein
MPDGSWGGPVNGQWVPPWTPWGWSGSVGQIPPQPPTLLGPVPQRPVCLVDAWGVFLADPAGNLIGVDTNWGRGGPLARVLDAGRSETRNL